MHTQSCCKQTVTQDLKQGNALCTHLSSTDVPDHLTSVEHTVPRETACVDLHSQTSSQNNNNNNTSLI